MKQIVCTALFIFISTSVWAAGWTPDDPLMPTGDSTQDTENLQTALHGSRLDSGGTLYLGSGTFRIHRVIGRQDVDPSIPSYSTVLFNGNIQGAGKDVTFLKAVRKPDGTGFEPMAFTWPGEPNPTFEHSLFVVVQTYLGISDLSINSEPELIDFHPWNALYYFYGIQSSGLIVYVATGSLFGEGNELIGTDLTNVHFKGSLDSFGVPETLHLFQQWGDRGGIHNVTGCEFENIWSGALEFRWLSGATINVGANSHGNVQFMNALEASFYVICDSCAVNVSHIETRDAPGVFFQTYGTNAHSTLTVEHSVIRTRPSSLWAGIEMWGSQDDFSFAIEKNKFYSEDTFLWGPIFSDVANQNGLIANNKFTGRGPAAMYLGVYDWRPGSVTTIGNNLDNWETTPDPWGLGTAPIWLGPFIVNSLVIGGDNEVNVFDEPAYDTNWNPLFGPDGKPLTVPGYGDLIPPEEISNLVPKNNIFTGVK